MMATATRQDDQGNVIQVGENELKEKKESTRTQNGKVQVMIGDKLPMMLMILETHPMEEHMDAIPWIPYHLTLWIS